MLFALLLYSLVASAHPLEDESIVVEKLYTRCVSPERPSLIKDVKPLPANVTREMVGTVSVAYNLSFAGRPVIYYVHGQGETIEDLERFFSFAQRRNLNMVSYDFPCYGKTPGVPTETTVVDAGMQVLKWLAKKSPKTPIVLWGQSLGAAVVFQVFKKNLDSAADKVAIFRIVTLSPWESFKTACRDRASFLAFKCSDSNIKDNKYASIDVAGVVNVPIMFVYSAGDSDIGADRSKKVAKKISPKFVRRIELDKKVPHLLINKDEVLEKLADFIDGKDDVKLEAVPKKNDF